MSSLVAGLMGDMIDVNLTGQVTANLIQNLMNVNLTGPIANQIAANLMQPWYGPIINLMVAVGTLALAFVTYLTLMEMRKEKTPNIEVKVERGSSPKKLLPFEHGTTVTIDAPVIKFKALNKGQRTVSLERFEVWLDSIEKLEVPYETVSYTPGQGTSEFLTPLPWNLRPGNNYLANVYTDELAKNLQNKGYTGEVDLIGRFIDPIENIYKSGPHKFDIDKASMGKA